MNALDLYTLLLLKTLSALPLLQVQCSPLKLDLILNSLLDSLLSGRDANVYLPTFSLSLVACSVSECGTDCCSRLSVGSCCLAAIGIPLWNCYLTRSYICTHTYKLP